MDLEVGQILWLKIKYNPVDIALEKHPMLIYSIDDEYIEVIAIDKAKDKIFQLMKKCNVYINVNNPDETVLYEDSYCQLNNRITLENFSEIVLSRRTLAKLSERKLQDILNKYKTYHLENIIDDNRQVHMTKSEILQLNPDLINNYQEIQ
ncbi:MAG: hypothetical protein HFI86_02265 [Bacilli bacterium]|nr:hypothetical protein [Bacilli bacterium]